MFSGTDPHDLLLRAAQPLKFTVYFGLPAAPRMSNGAIWEEYLPAYYGFVYRVLMAHKAKSVCTNDAINTLFPHIHAQYL